MVLAVCCLWTVCCEVVLGSVLCGLVLCWVWSLMEGCCFSCSASYVPVNFLTS